MEHRQLGRSGLRVSALCIGTATFGSQVSERDAFAILDRAVEGGISFVDTADMYPAPAVRPGLTEEIVGAWLAGRPRDSIVLSSKVWSETGPGLNDRGLSRGHILNAVDASLRRLGTDYLDIYHCHFPDDSVRIEETVQVLDDLVRWGKVRYIGASNYAAWELARSFTASDRLGVTRYQCLQPRYNMLYRQLEDDLLPLCRAEGVGVIAYNPLAGGLLTGKYDSTEDLREDTRFMLGSAGPRYRDRYWHGEHFREVERLNAYFKKREIPLTLAAVAWTLAQDGITSAIVGASRREQIEETLKYGDVELTEDDFAFCDEAWYNLPRIRE